MKVFQFLWNKSKYQIIDEYMIGYNQKYWSFKQHMQAKLIINEFKLWYLACSKMKFVMNLKVYTKKVNEAILELSKHACRLGIIVVP